MAAAIDRAAWAALIARLLVAETAGNKTSFAAMVGVDRKTVTRWLSAEVAVSEESVRTVARHLGLQPRDLLVEVGYYAAAELTPEPESAAAQVAEDDEAIRLIRESDAPPRLKRELIAYVMEQRKVHEEQRRAETERMLRLAQLGRRDGRQASG